VKGGAAARGVLECWELLKENVDDAISSLLYCHPDQKSSNGDNRMRVKENHNCTNDPPQYRSKLLPIFYMMDTLEGMLDNLCIHLVKFLSWGFVINYCIASILHQGDVDALVWKKKVKLIIWVPLLATFLKKPTYCCCIDEQAVSF
jgi:hypothetical protein